MTQHARPVKLPRYTDSPEIQKALSIYTDAEHLQHRLDYLASRDKRTPLTDMLDSTAVFIAPAALLLIALGKDAKRLLARGDNADIAVAAMSGADTLNEQQRDCIARFTCDVRGFPLIIRYARDLLDNPLNDSSQLTEEKVATKPD